MSLSERLRPDVEAAPWVIEEVKALEAEIEALKELKKRAEADILFYQKHIFLVEHGQGGVEFNSDGSIKDE